MSSCGEDGQQCTLVSVAFIVIVVVLAGTLLFGIYTYRKTLLELKEAKRLDNAFQRQRVVANSGMQTGSSDGKRTNPWEIPMSELVLGERLSEGSSGLVVKGQWLGTTVAVKLPHKHLSSLLKQKFREEAVLMSKLHHPNIVIFLGACLQEDSLALVLEFLENGSMHDFLHSKKAKVDLGLTHHFAMDICRGMKYLHNRCNVVQRDLKPRNLLIDYSFNVKLCDFGLSKHLQNENSMTACGTPYWTAPEIMRQESYGNKADVYSFAIILWELITREDPYDGLPGLEVAIKVAHDNLRPKIPNFCPEYYKDLIVQCWDDNPKMRPTFSQIFDRLLEIKKAEKITRLKKSDSTNLLSPPASPPPQSEQTRAPRFSITNALYGKSSAKSSEAPCD